MNAAMLGIKVVQGSMETFVIIGLGSSLLGIKREVSGSKFLLIFFAIGIICTVSREIQLFQNFHTFIISVCIIILVKHAFRIALPRAILVVLLGLTILALVESISILVITRLSGSSFAQITADPWLRIKYTFPHLAFLVAVTFFVNRQKNWGCDFFLSESETTGERGGKKTTLAYTLSNFMLFQMIVLTVLNIFMNLTITGIIRYSISQTQILGVNLFLTVSSILALLVYRKLFQIAEQEVLLNAQKALLQNVNELFNTIRAQRHDFVNQLQSIYGHLVLGKVDECRAYVGGLVQETADFSELLSVNHPGLCALLLSKTAVAESKKILLKIESDENLENLQVKPHHLNDMIGNLIDNAFEAVLTEPPEKRLVWVKISGNKNYFSFRVINKGSLIPNAVISKLFNPGFTTKNPKEHMGMGLHSVKTLVEKYDGQLGVKSEEPEGTVFTIVLPQNT